ncbi:MAG: hypothetical protein JW810_06290, partial [Sedimentisphaerales bacterium]|nr:hypothetical protein [Sedimentisphaerales bacterium]
RVKVALGEAPGLISGMFARLRIPTGRYEALVVPRRALRRVGQLELVEVVDHQGCAQKRFVTLGPLHGTQVEVLSGLAEGEQVVIP